MMRSLRSRLMLGASALAILFMLALLPVLQNAFDQTMEQIIQQRLAADTNTMISTAQLHNGILQMPEKMPDEEFNLPEATLLGFVYDQSGTLLWSSRSAQGQAVQYAPFYSGGTTDFLQIYNENGNGYYVYDVEVFLDDSSNPPFSFITMLPKSEFLPLTQKFDRQLYTWLGGGLLILLVLLWLGLTWGFRALKSLSRELDQIEGGHRDQLGEQHPRELLRLTRSLNRLLDSERRQRQRYQDSLADLAHSLKTPLAVLQSVAERVAQEPSREQADILQTQINRMSQQIDFQLRRASLRRSGLVQHRVQLDPLLVSVTSTLAKVYDDKQVHLQLDLADNFWVPMERGALMEMLGNLLENAYRLCLKQVHVSARHTAGHCEIIVEDDGAGVPEHQREVILRRGERLDAQHAGQGIGLSVVKDIIESYEGELVIDQSGLGGARFKIILNTEGMVFSSAAAARRSRRQKNAQT
ncbi:ATP-binding protein [Halopseudomonas pelagia]|uniref:ATP-binding protein n=1 Tax=Halopseudomonas pelagia TaxID=553151 RepID=UPI0030D95C67